MTEYYDTSSSGVSLLPPDVQPHLEAYLDGTLVDQEIVLHIESAMLHSESCRDQLAVHHMLHGLSDDAWHLLGRS